MGEAKRIGNYEVHAKVGESAVSTVFKATHVGTGETVALRVLSKQYAQDAEFTKGFLAEARAAGRATHQNLCEIKDVGQDRGLYFIASEFVEGASLEQLLKRQGRLPADRAQSYLKEAALALGAAHDFGLIHGNIKPSNLLISSETTGLKITDLGVAHDRSQHVQQMELGLAGAPYYMAPELGKGLQGSMQSDLYSLGATIYHLLAGTPPFTGPHATAILMKHAGEKPTPLNTLDPAVPKKLSDVIQRLLAKEPDDRYSDPRDMIKALGTGVELAPKRPKAEKRADRPRMGASGGAKRPRTTTGGGRPVGGARKQSGLPLPALVGGGVVILLIAGLLYAFGTEDPAITRADAAISEARSLLAHESPENLERGSQVLREAIGALPPGARSMHRKNEADRVIEQIELKLLSVSAAQIGKVVSSVRVGKTDAASAAQILGQVEQRYNEPGIPAKIRERAMTILARARVDITAAVKAGPTAKESTASFEAAEAIKPDIERLVREGRFAEAVMLIDAVRDAAENKKEKEFVDEIRSKVVKAASKNFAAVIRRVRILSGDEKFKEGRAALKAIQTNYAFAPYEDRISEAIANLDTYISEQGGGRAPAPAPAPRPRPAQPERRPEPTRTVERQPEPAAEPEPAPRAPASAASSKAAVAKAIDDAVGYIQDGDMKKVAQVLLQLRRDHGTSTAYAERKGEIEALLQMAEQ